MADSTCSEKNLYMGKLPMQWQFSEFSLADTVLLVLAG